MQLIRRHSYIASFVTFVATLLFGYTNCSPLKSRNTVPIAESCTTVSDIATGSLGLQAPRQRPNIERGSESDARIDYEKGTAEINGRQVHFEESQGLFITEGDILLNLPPRESDLSTSSSVETLSLGTRVMDRIWPGGRIPYVIGTGDMAPPNLQLVRQALEHWRSQARGVLESVPRTNEVNYVVIRRKDSHRPEEFCAANVGMIGGAQQIQLGSYCGFGNIVHEIGHVVGLQHEHMRADRDRYVEILYQNIRPEYHDQFRQYLDEGQDLGNYDYASIMHYPQNAGATGPNLTTIRPIQSGVTIGQRESLSNGDVEGVRSLYDPKRIPPWEDIPCM